VGMRRHRRRNGAAQPNAVCSASQIIARAIR
jgi:hypothetical protein